MAGEMSESEVTREAYPLYFIIADEFEGTVRPFDQYQGPYVQTKHGKFWMGTVWDGAEWYVYNERTGRQSHSFPIIENDEELTRHLVINAAYEILNFE